MVSALVWDSGFQIWALIFVVVHMAVRIEVGAIEPSLWT